MIVSRDVVTKRSSLQQLPMLTNSSGAVNAPANPSIPCSLARIRHSGLFLMRDLAGHSQKQKAGGSHAHPQNQWSKMKHYSCG